MVHNDGIVSQVDSRPFKIGENIATSPGAVIYRSEIMELIQYAPTSETVHEIPLLIIPPQINKAYINDLTPEKSIIRYELAHGIQPFLISWRNPQIEHREWNRRASRRLLPMNPVFIELLLRRRPLRPGAWARSAACRQAP